MNEWEINKTFKIKNQGGNSYIEECEPKHLFHDLENKINVYAH